MPDRKQLNEGRVCFSSLFKKGSSPVAGKACQWRNEEAGHTASTSRDQTTENKLGQATVKAQGTPLSDPGPPIKFHFIEVPWSLPTSWGPSVETHESGVGHLPFKPPRPLLGTCGESGKGWPIDLGDLVFLMMSHLKKVLSCYLGRFMRTQKNYRDQCYVDLSPQTDSSHQAGTSSD